MYLWNYKDLVLPINQSIDMHLFTSIDSELDHLCSPLRRKCMDKRQGRWQESDEDEEKDGQDGGEGGNLGEEIEIAGFRRNAGLVGRDRIARIRDGACSRAKINRIFQINAYLRASKWYRVFSTGTGQVPFLDAPGISLQSLSRVTHLLAYPPFWLWPLHKTPALLSRHTAG